MFNGRMHQRSFMFAMMVLWALSVSRGASAALTPQFEPTRLPNWTPHGPGEHPRLFFRKADLSLLRQKAATPEGQAIVAQLDKCLAGAYTLSHGCGWGFRYQLTGDEQYAVKAREAVERALDGAPDRDSRYSFRNPGGQLRAGPSIAMIAMAYDLCYDAWDAEYRIRVLKELLYYDAGDEISVQAMALMPKHPPASNHYGATVGGAGIAMLAIRGDPGADDTLVGKYLEIINRNAARAITEGFGHAGYFTEHAGPSHVMANTALVPFYQASALADGKDWLAPGANMSWLTMRWAHEILPSGGRPYYPLRHPSGYGTENFLDMQGGMSHGGWFSQGFGTVSEKDKQALLWVYDNFVSQADLNRYDAVNYPHRAMLALVNWPIGVEAINPAKIMSKARLDTSHGYAVFRNGWKDSNDIIVTALLGTRWTAAYNKIGSERVMVWGLGKRLSFGFHFRQFTTYFSSAPDGSGVLSGVPLDQCDLQFDTEKRELYWNPRPTAPVTSLAVDYSLTSGAEALLAMVGPGATGGIAHVAGLHEFRIMTLQTGAAPAVSVVDDSIKVGNQTVWFDGKKINFGMYHGAPVTSTRMIAAAGRRYGPDELSVSTSAGKALFHYRGAATALSIFGIDGKHIAEIAPVRPGGGLFLWPASSSAGAQIAPGTYVARLHGGSRDITRHFTFRK